ncbi:pumilio homolog 23 [Impatiens glandulifera]|uniref:pumilio homolog 23 n=1 Tax=Impatiens glandulifera TaxID=253017 RepID=UPI001FB120A1|nr:pumilio homolog 23 [Impatiens glandulifera]
MGREGYSNGKKGRRGGNGGKPNRNRDAGFNGGASNYQTDFGSQSSFVRKPVDPETSKYFSEIANVIANPNMELEERSVICGNALDESRGKEVELATDYILSHTLQSLMENSDLNQICGFLQSCAKDFPLISMDKSGSHVAEEAFKSLARHLEEEENRPLLEKTLAMLCQELVMDPVNVMCNCYASHVLRSLLCLCKGAPFESLRLRNAKSSSVLAERLNLKPAKPNRIVSVPLQHGFPDLFKSFILDMLKHGKKDIKTLLADQYSSLVLQTALKLLSDSKEELLQIIPILLGHDEETAPNEFSIKASSAKKLLALGKDTAFSRLMEVILEVAPDTIFNELLMKVFRHSMFELSSDQSGNYIIQSLISHAKSENHMELIWEELGSKFDVLLGMGKPGVVASIIAASQRLHSHENKCCQAIASSVCSTNESPNCIIARLLFLDRYFSCNDPSSWDWPTGTTMNLMGSLILQLIFRFPTDFIQPFITSITSLEMNHILEASKDIAGQRVLEAFLNSDASGKHKRKLVVKLKGHFAELALNRSGAFTVEKCFSTSNMALRETIVSELLVIQSDLSKSNHGTVMLKKLDVDGYARRPDQWKSMQVTKESTFKEFYDTFGSKESKPKNNSFVLESGRTPQAEKMKQLRNEVYSSLAILTPHSDKGGKSKPKLSGHKREHEREEQHDKKVNKKVVDDDSSKSQNKKKKKKNH